MINERVKTLRKHLNLTMERFGERLGVRKTAISLIESGRNNLTDQMFLAICREFNVNEEWLRNGEGEMFTTSKGEYIDQVVKKYNLDDLDRSILETYLSLSESSREIIKKYILDVVKSYEMSEKQKEQEQTVSEKEAFLKLAEEQFDKEKGQESQASSVSESDVG